MVLIVGRTCPMCHMAKEFVEDNHIEADIKFQDEVTDLIEKHFIMSVPSLVDGDIIARGAVEVMSYLTKKEGGEC